MIIYRKTSHLRLQRVPIPEPPYWAATIIAPYSPRRAEPIAIDYLDLQATRARQLAADHRRWASQERIYASQVDRTEEIELVLSDRSRIARNTRVSTGDM